MIRMAALSLALALAIQGAACAAWTGDESRKRSGAAGSRQREAYRRVQRAYDGAPPVIPHAVEELQRQDCLACHGEGLRVIGEGLAPRTPHPHQLICRQCHVEQVAENDGLARNRFQGMRHPGRGSRAYAGAPPTVPHPLAGRNNCLGCHGDGGGSPITTPHADRVNCSQCHVPQAVSAEWRGNTFEGAFR